MFIVEMKHDALADAEMSSFETREKAVAEVDLWFRSCGFELKEGKPYDPGNEDGANGGFEAFAHVVIETINGQPMVSSFESFWAEGPRCRIIETP